MYTLVRMAGICSAFRHTSITSASRPLSSSPVSIASESVPLALAVSHPALPESRSKHCANTLSVKTLTCNDKAYVIFKSLVSIRLMPLQ